MTLAARLSRSTDAVLTFRTDASWTVHQLQSVLHALQLGYGVLLSLAVLEVMAEDADNTGSWAIDRTDVALLSQLTNSWSSKLAAESALASWLPAYGPDIKSEERAFLQTLRASVWYNESQLRLHRIRIESPGFISFKGLGEPLRELRQLIKDLSYANAQEKERGELEIEAMRLALKQSKRAIKLRDAEATDRTVVFLTDSLRQLRRHEEAGRLPALPEVADDDPAA